MEYWLAENWFILLSSVGIVGGLVFNAVSLRSEARTRRIANLLIITQNHREIWSQLYKRPELWRVLDANANIATVPVRLEEEIFVNFLLLHLNSSFRAMKEDVFFRPEGLRADIRRFFSLPIPAEIWKRMKPFQDEDFTAYVESSIH